MLLCTTLVLPRRVAAQEQTFEQSYSVYAATYAAYRDTYAQFLKSKSSYLTYRTLTAQTEYLVTAKKLLETRDDVLITYIDLLFTRNVDPNYNDILFEQKFKLLEHKAAIAAVATLKDAQRSFDQSLEKHYSVIQNLSRQIVGTIILAKVENTQEQLEAFEQQSSLLIEQLKQQGIDVTTLERWLLQARDKRQLAQTNLTNARGQIPGLTPGGSFNKFQLTINSANQYLNEAGDFYTELLQEIKYGNY